MHFVEFGYTRVSKMFGGIYRNTTWLQQVQIWRPLAPNSRNRFFWHFSINLAILSLLRHAHTRYFRQCGARSRRSPNWPFHIKRYLYSSIHNRYGPRKLLIPKIAFLKSPYLQEYIAVLWCGKPFGYLLFQIQNKLNLDKYCSMVYVLWKKQVFPVIQNKIPYITLRKLGPFLSPYIYFKVIYGLGLQRASILLLKVIYGLKNGPRLEVIYGILFCITGYV